MRQSNPRTEYTSARIAKIAGRILRIQCANKNALVTFWGEYRGHIAHDTMKWADLAALAGSVLTQVKDKPKSAKPKRKRKARG